MHGTHRNTQILANPSQILFCESLRIRRECARMDTAYTVLVCGPEEGGGSPIVHRASPAVHGKILGAGCLPLLREVLTQQPAYPVSDPKFPSHPRAPWRLARGPIYIIQQLKTQQAAGQARSSMLLDRLHKSTWTCAHERPTRPYDGFR